MKHSHAQNTANLITLAIHCIETHQPERARRWLDGAWDESKHLPDGEVKAQLHNAINIALGALAK